ncbi:MAG: hypothetical protein PHF63_00615 [Herbinix sp.]|nr:hypothetical protein [Herbinix sp.]
MDVEIRRVLGHYEAYDKQGNFLCSGDTPKECIDEIEKDSDEI